MAKKVSGYIKLQVTGGQANPAPPVGPALGQHGVNIMEFCKQFNARTKDLMGITTPVVITVYADRSFSFITKTPPAAVLLQRASGIKKGSGVPNKTKVGTVTQAQIEEIEKTKMPDLNAASLETACKMVAGTARSMGVEVQLNAKVVGVDAAVPVEASVAASFEDVHAAFTDALGSGDDQPGKANPGKGKGKPPKKEKK